MKKVLITGYAPSGGEKFDATCECVKRLHRKKLGNTQIIGEVIPYSSLPAFKIIEASVLKNNFDSIVSMGTMNSSQGISLIANFKNCLGFKNEIPVWNTNNAKPILSSRVNIIDIQNTLEEKNIPSKVLLESPISIHNSLGYLIAKMIESNHRLNHMRNLFINVPLVWDYKSEYMFNRNEYYLEREKYYEALELIINNI